MLEKSGLFTRIGIIHHGYVTGVIIMQRFFSSFHVLNFARLRYSLSRVLLKSSLILTGLVTNLLCFSVSAAVITIDGIVHPESACTTRDGRIFISEIGGVGKKGDGRILEIFTNGDKKVIASGLNDPKGLLVEGNTIYVTDVDEIKKVSFDGKVSSWIGPKDFPRKISFLNDLTIDRNTIIYVSDSGEVVDGERRGGAVYRISSTGKVSLLVDSANNPNIQAPNGLLAFQRGFLMVADFTTGVLSRIRLRNFSVEKMADGFGGGDGLAFSGTKLYISDWRGGKIWSIDLTAPGQNPRLFKEGFTNPADIDVTSDGKFLVVPEMMKATVDGGRVNFLPIK